MPEFRWRSFTGRTDVFCIFFQLLILASSSAATFRHIQPQPTMNYLIPLAIVSNTFAAHAVEIRLQDCPPGVKATIEAELDGGRIDEIDRVQRNGTTRYIVDLDGPARRDITLHLTPAGKVVFSTEDVNLSQCPPAVRASIRKLLKSGWRIDDIDREVSGNTIRFRVDFDRTKDRDLEFLLARNGKVLDRKVENSD
jgi:uncharacterized membrane protein YkoI